nr:hypothetical protein [Cytophagales bacterium]
MLVKTENNEFVPAAIYVAEILSEGLGLEQVTEEDAQDALAELYVNGYNEESATVFSSGIMPLQKASLAAIDKGDLWKRLKKFLCDFIKEDGSATWGEIVEKVLEFLSGLIPGGILIKKLVKAIVKYIIDYGIGKLCPAV